MTETLESQQLAQWMREHGRPLRGYLRGLVGNDDLIDDLMQEVFCRVWQARARYVEQGQTRAYLLRIADRVACDCYRRRRPETNLEQKEFTQSVDIKADPVTRAANNEESQKLSAALEELTPLQKRALLLRYFGDLSFAEISVILECPLSTALSHCHRGLQALRKHFEGQES